MSVLADRLREDKHINGIKPEKPRAPLEQTVENLQRLMERDAQLMWEQEKELKQLRDQNQRLANRLAKRGENEQ
tara:strand:- start:51 stop:272 length:222 start_codon:yes stop_codon:yes gene_type:complete